MYKKPLKKIIKKYTVVRVMLLMLFFSVCVSYTSQIFAQSSWEEARKQQKKDEKQRKKQMKNQEKPEKKGVGVQKWDNKFDKKPARRKRGENTQQGKNNPDSENKKPKIKKSKKQKAQIKNPKPKKLKSKEK